MHTTTEHDNLRVTTITLGELATNCYFVWDAKSYEAIIVDPADSGEFLAELVLELQLTHKAIVFTHGHFDHVLGSLALTTILNIPSYIDAADAPLLAKAQKSAEHWLKHPVDPVLPASYFLEHRTPFFLGLDILSMPGHTPGSVGIGKLSGTAPFICCGDVITDEGIGASHHRYSSPIEMSKSLAKLSALPNKTQYYPGHGVPLSQAELKAILAGDILSSVQ